MCNFGIFIVQFLYVMYISFLVLIFLTFLSRKTGNVSFTYKRKTPSKQTTTKTNKKNKTKQTNKYPVKHDKYLSRLNMINTSAG